MAGFLIIDGKFATKNHVGFYTIGQPTVSPDIDPTTNTVELTAYDKVTAATNKLLFGSNVTITEATHLIQCNNAE